MATGRTVKRGVARLSLGQAWDVFHSRSAWSICACRERDGVERFAGCPLLAAVVASINLVMDSALVKRFPPINTVSSFTPRTPR